MWEKQSEPEITSEVRGSYTDTAQRGALTDTGQRGAITSGGLLTTWVLQEKSTV